MASSLKGSTLSCGTTTTWPMLSRRDIPDRIPQYNEDDCKAMVVLKQFFAAQMRVCGCEMA